MYVRHPQASLGPQQFLSSMSPFICLETTVFWKGFTALFTLIGFLSRMYSSLNVEITPLSKDFSTLIAFTGFLFNMISFMPSISSKSWTMSFNIMVFPFVAYSSEVTVGLQDYIFVKTFLGRTQQSLLFQSEVDMYVIIGHYIAISLRFVYSKPGKHMHVRQGHTIFFSVFLFCLN